MPVYCGVDFHARQQTVCYCDTADGEIYRTELGHRKDDVRSFYCQFTSEVSLARFDYPNGPKGVNFITHFEGISSPEPGIYTLSADSVQTEMTPEPSMN